MSRNSDYLTSYLDKLFLSVLSIFILSACTTNDVQTDMSTQTDNATAQKAAVVKIVKNQGVYEWTVNGEPFTVKGVGLSYDSGREYAALKSAGGNAFRTWTTNYADMVMEEARKHGLMVAMGLEVDKELHGFDYNDEAAVAKQFADAKKMIQKYKNHPNLLAWVVANEPNLLFNPDGSLATVNPKVYESISDIIDYIHAEDPNHPVTYTFAGANPTHIKTAMQYTPQVDFISVQVYGGLGDVHEEYQLSNIDKPFMVTEFGPKGHWETPSTEWNREIEEPSTIKAAGMIERMQESLGNNKSGLNIGGFAFLWGQKQERTPTWYGMYHKDGSQMERIDELTKFWTGDYPDNRAPQVTEITINQLNPQENIYLAPNSAAIANIKLHEPDGDEITCKWVILKEVDERSDGGAYEKEPADIPFKRDASQSNCEQGQLAFTTPAKDGDYRLFAYVYDGKGKVGYANAPFFIK
jgi:hypothetical protein